ncbi:MAG TPA: serine/threonine-protein kinase, partial [Polyangiaceae bacterium]
MTARVVIGPGTRVADRYLILEEIGRGGMGVVFVARDEETAREVALKVLRHAPQREAARRLQREARAMNALDARRVAQVLEIGETPSGELYLVMEYVRGRNVRSLLRAGRVPLEESLRIVGEVAATLGEAHRVGLVHRDVKPDNIMVADGGRVVLLDFGVVKSVEMGHETALASTQLTNDGAVIGTPAYLSPEQALGRSVGPETDQFALAVTAYELLTGSLPWTATEMTTMLAQVLAEVPPPASTFDKLLKPAIDSVLARALSKKPDERFPSIEDFATSLRAAERGEYQPPPRIPSTNAPASRRFGRVSVLFGAIAVVGSMLGLGLRSRVAKNAPSALRTPRETAISALAGPDGFFACPIIEVRGMSDGLIRLGAAAATIACTRAVWSLGGSDDRVLPPAALLGVPREPAPGFADPYIAEARGRSLDAARTRAAAYLDGTATYDAQAWSIDLVLKAPTDQEIVRAQGRGDTYLVALKDALDRLWKPPLSIRTIDPEVARWTGFPDVEVGRIEADLWLLGARDGCDALRARAAALGDAYIQLAGACRDDLLASSVDAGL